MSPPSGTFPGPPAARPDPSPWCHRPERTGAPSRDDHRNVTAARGTGTSPRTPRPSGLDRDGGVEALDRRGLSLPRPPQPERDASLPSFPGQESKGPRSASPQLGFRSWDELVSGRREDG